MMLMNVEQNTKHVARETQIERQVQKKTYTQDTDSMKQANRQGMCVRETETIISKAPRLGIHNPLFALNSWAVVKMTCDCLSSIRFLRTDPLSKIGHNVFGLACNLRLTGVKRETHVAMRSWAASMTSHRVPDNR